jgi:hypothetical protein
MLTSGFSGQLRLPQATHELLCGAQFDPCLCCLNEVQRDTRIDLFKDVLSGCEFLIPQQHVSGKLRELVGSGALQESFLQVGRIIEREHSIELLPVRGARQRGGNPRFRLALPSRA